MGRNLLQYVHVLFFPWTEYEFSFPLLSFSWWQVMYESRKLDSPVLKICKVSPVRGAIGFPSIIYFSN
jgi:hypothetical protein